MTFQRWSRSSIERTLPVRALVTGAAGFIGSTLVDRLLADGHEVIAVDSLSRGRLANLAPAMESGAGAFTFLRADVTDQSFVDLVVDTAPTVLFHLAAQIDVRLSVANPSHDARVNVLGTINVLEAARRAAVRKVLFASSGGSIYGEPGVLPVSEQAALDPQSPYAVSKVSGELYLGAYAGMYGLRYTSLALSNVYGPRQDPHGEAGVVAIFASALLSGGQGTIFGAGSASRDYVYVNDVVEAFVTASGDVGDGRRYNIGTGAATTVRQLHSRIAAAAGAADRPVFAEPRRGEVQSISLDTAAARTDLGWSPRTDLTEGIAATVDWVRQELACSAGIAVAG